MRQYSDRISLVKNARGIYSLDTTMGCTSGMENEKGGCFNDCYAAKSAKLYGYDFTKTVLRRFYDRSHRRQIIREISNVKLDFIRIGTSGDPSENWTHTVSIIKEIERCNKIIVIITKHWTTLSDEQISYFSGINICVNTSVSALDKPEIIQRCICEYNRLKTVCRSVLRIVSCDFNLSNPIGFMLSKLQESLFKNDDVLDTVLRVNKNNPYLKDGIINTKKGRFLGKNTTISKFNKKTYFGKCSTCKEMCGINMEIENKQYPEKTGIVKQLKFNIK